MRHHCRGELLLILSYRANHSDDSDYATYRTTEIRVRRRPAAHADSGTDTVIDNFRELCFLGTKQSTPGSRQNCWVVSDGVEDAQSGGMVSAQAAVIVTSTIRYYVDKQESHV